jgi:hypothetical protein
MGRPAEEILFGTKKHIQDVCPRRGPSAADLPQRDAAAMTAKRLQN